MSAPRIYDVVMGDAMGRLAVPIREFHRAPSPARFAGRAVITRGNGALALLVAATIGLPSASPGCAVEIEIACDDDGAETWRRSFAGKPFESLQRAGRGNWSGLMVEQIGPMSFAYALIEREGALHLDVRGWKAFGLAMPRCLGPKAIAFEHAADGRFNFDVTMGLPLIGRLVHYRGWLEPVR